MSLALIDRLVGCLIDLLLAGIIIIIIIIIVITNNGTSAMIHGAVTMTRLP